MNYDYAPPVISGVNQIVVRIVDAVLVSRRLWTLSSHPHAKSGRMGG